MPKKMHVYDETVLVNTVKDGKVKKVRFCDLKAGDNVGDTYCFVCDNDAHVSGDSQYDGWLVHSTTGNAYFPEDFGAKRIK